MVTEFDMERKTVDERMREQIGKTGQERRKKRHLRLRADLSDCMKFRVSDDRLRTVMVGTCITGTRGSE